MTTVLISVGSNLNNPQQQIKQAFKRLNDHFRNVRMSSFYLTEPVGGVPQAAFVNAGLQLETDLSAHELLNQLMDVERQSLRNRENELPNHPRTLDLDIILFGDQVINAPKLTIPHPRFTERKFVLVPLAEIAPDAIDPLNRKSIAQLLEACDDLSWVKRLNEEVVSL